MSKRAFYDKELNFLTNSIIINIGVLLSLKFGFMQSKFIFSAGINFYNLQAINNAERL